MKKTWAKWMPAVVVPAVVVAGAVAIPLSANAAPPLPEKTAQELLLMVAQNEVTAFSGTIEQTSDLGLPALPSSAGSDAGSALELLTGSHELRLFVDGADRSRIQVLDELAERNVIRNGSDLWYYDSDTDEAAHLAVPAGSGEHAPAPGSATPPTPAEVADQLIAAIEPSTDVTVDENARVAGRAAYVLTITPKTDDTLVASAALSIDSETGFPLAVEVSARDQSEPAFEVAFSDIDFSAPDADLFDFTPPADATVTEVELPTDASSAEGHADYSGVEPTFIGEGWSTVAVLPAGSLGASPDAAADDQAELTETLDQLTTRVDGGRVLETSLLSVLLTDDGRVLVGAVPAEALQAAAQ